MRRRVLVVGGAFLATSLVLGVAAAAGGRGRPFSTPLTGAEEAPAQGANLDASGQADLTLNQGQGEVCFDISWTDVDGEVFAGHVHIGPPRSAGPIVVTLFTGSFAGTAAVSGCVDGVDPALIKDIRHDPEAYYVNVHSRPAFTGGAIGSQLAR
jgi:hypothetical protein